MYNYDDLCVFVEGPTSEKVAFCGSWLQSASQAEIFWKHALSEPDFAREVDLLTVVYIPDFELAAWYFLTHLQGSFDSLIIKFNDGQQFEWGCAMDEFVMMFEMGFFSKSASGYMMTIPVNLSPTKVKAAALRYAQTQDNEYLLHPEDIVSLKTISEARQLQSHRLAIADFIVGADKPPFGTKLA